jgi:GT2 family glycosyltransferase
MESGTQGLLNPMAKPSLISVITVNYQRSSDTVRLIESLTKLKFPASLLEVIIIDNGSNDLGKASLTQKLKPFVSKFRKLQLRTNSSNIGLSRALNQAYELVNPKTEYIWRLDNDILLDKLSLTKLLDVLQQTVQVGAVGSQAFNMDEPSQSICGGWHYNWWLGNGQQFNSSVATATDFVSGYSLLIRKKLVDEIGYLSAPAYNVYVEDVEFCRRIWEGGNEVWYIPESKVFHRYVPSKNVAPYAVFHLTRNRFWVMRQHASRLQLGFFGLYFLFAANSYFCVKLLLSEVSAVQKRQVFITYFRALQDCAAGCRRGCR